MDIISYGIASKVSKQAGVTSNILGSGVEGESPHVKGRIDNLETAIDSVNGLANKLIVNDAINIMKAHAKLNAIAKITKYKMHNMVFEDFLDASGVDSVRSSSIASDTTNGLIKTSGPKTWKTMNHGDTDPLTQGWNNTWTTTLMQPVSIKDDVLEYSFIDTQHAGLSYSTGIQNDVTKEATLLIRMSLENLLSFSIRMFAAGTSLDYIFREVNPSTGKIKMDIYQGGNYVTVAQLDPGKFYTFRFELSGGSPRKRRLYIDDVLINEYNEASHSSHVLQMHGSVKAGVVGKLRIEHMYYGDYLNVSGGTEMDPDNIDYGKHVLYTTTEVAASIPIKAILVVEENNPTPLGTYFISRDEGLHWEKIVPEELFEFNNSISLQDKKIRLRAEIPTGTQLLNYALTWV